MITEESLLAVLSDQGATGREVWERLGMWSENAVRSHLVRMAKAGTIDRYQQAIASGFQWMYRRKPV